MPDQKHSAIWQTVYNDHVREMHSAYTMDGTIHRRFNAQLQKAEPEAPIDGFFVKCAGRQACVLSSFIGKSDLPLLPLFIASE